MGALAELDKSVLALKLKKARDYIRRPTGRCGGPLPFGSKPEDRPLWTYINGRRAAGVSYAAVAQGLTAQGLPGWSKDRVRSVLRYG
jgi:hypothetical protein